MAGLDETRIVLLGKTGAGKSSLGNTILGESLLGIADGPTSGTEECQAESKDINRVRTTVIDTPGFFDTKMEEKKLITEILMSVKKWLPGPHAFLIVLKVDRFTEQERELINKILQYFSEEALKYAVVVFTHGDQLSDGHTIEDFCGKNKDLSDLVKKCGGRCQVVDNKYWNDKPDGYRNNKFHVAQLLNTIQTMKKKQGFYSNELLKIVEEDKSGNILKFLSSISTGLMLAIVFGFTLGPGIAPVFAIAGGLIGAAIGHFSATPQEAVAETAKALQILYMAKAASSKMANLK